MQNTGRCRYFYVVEVVVREGRVVYNQSQEELEHGNKRPFD